MRLQKLANWLSEGDLEQYKEQVKQAQKEQSNVQKMKSEIEEIKSLLQQKDKELAQAQAQLQINKGFQIELGETQLMLQKANAETQKFKKDIFEQHKQLNLANSQLQQAQHSLANSQNWLASLKAVVQIADIQKTLPKQDFETLWGFGIISPKVNASTEFGVLLVKGWVLGKKANAKSLRVSYQDNILLKTIVNQNRPKIMQRYPDIPTARNCGFEFALSISSITKVTKLTLEAALEDKTIVPLCEITLDPEQSEAKST